MTCSESHSRKVAKQPSLTPRAGPFLPVFFLPIRTDTRSGDTCQGSIAHPPSAERLLPVLEAGWPQRPHLCACLCSQRALDPEH